MISTLMAAVAAKRAYYVLGGAGEVLASAPTLGEAMELAKALGVPVRILSGGVA